MTDREKIERLTSALWHMVDKFEPFTLKPMGAPGSSARVEQDRQIEAHMRATELLSEIRAAAARSRQATDLIGWIDSWVSNPAASYSTAALEGLFGMTRDKIAALALSSNQRTPQRE